MINLFNPLVYITIKKIEKLLTNHLVYIPHKTKSTYLQNPNHSKFSSTYRCPPWNNQISTMIYSTNITIKPTVVKHPNSKHNTVPETANINCNKHTIPQHFSTLQSMKKLPSSLQGSKARSVKLVDKTQSHSASPKINSHQYYHAQRITDTWYIRQIVKKKIERYKL